ncbi:hypothetical protein H1D32_08475 [Anaerobacillus sp. CMMVII]|uniref:hypothetical protein n=1 Tax=Anaerobacillus sp. CMMVII TaxID=2755588 RepID=UPI0021B7C4EF|nr:hypothetical protein [Anaerobacillus sp. CMMVII]MCT8137788.1 hypothetical protein [Anaerobacillus sp. CMMVII]
MATYKPIKRYLIPLVALFIGGSLAFLFVPSKMDYEWKIWRDQTIEWEKQHYAVKGSFTLNGEVVTNEIGDWSEENSHLNVSVVVSDDSVFEFQVVFQEERIYINSADTWYQNELSPRFVEEFAPLYQPFSWMRELLKEADRIEKNRGGELTTYTAFFDTFDKFEFRGYELSEQEQTSLTVIEKEGQIQSFTFDVNPIRPETIGPLDSYPNQLSYTMSFTIIDEVQIVLPKEAYEGEKLE